MKVFDYRIEERFDFDEMRTYYVVQKYDLFMEEYFTYLSRKFELLSEAKEAIRMLRRCKKPIYHYVE